MYRTQCIDNERHAVGIGITISRSACYRMLTRDYSDDQLNWAPFPQKCVWTNQPQTPPPVRVIFERVYRTPSFYPRDVHVVSGVATATWLAGWLGGWLAVCHSRYCIKTTKPILKLIRPPDSPIIEAFGSPCADTKLQGEPLQRGR